MKSKSTLKLSMAVASALYLAVSPLGLPLLSGLSPASASAEEQPTFKSDVPKLDLAPTAPAHSPSVLKGNIEHRIKSSPPPKSKPKKLNSRISRPDFGPMSGGLKGQMDKNANLQAGISAPYTIDKSVGIIGIKFMKIGDRPPVVNRVFPGTPAYNTGFSVDDMIVAVDGVPTSGLTKDECYDLIVGTPNTPITVTLMHQGSFEVKNMTRMDFNDIPDPMVRRDYLHSL